MPFTRNIAHKYIPLLGHRSVWRVAARLLRGPSSCQEKNQNDCVAQLMKCIKEEGSNTWKGSQKNSNRGRPSSNSEEQQLAFSHVVVTGLKRALFKTIWPLDSETRPLDSETRQNLKFSNYSYTILTQYLYNIYTISLTMTYNGLQWFGQWNNNGHFIAMVIIFYFLPLFINVVIYCSILMVINFYFKPSWNNVIFLLLYSF